MTISIKGNVTQLLAAATATLVGIPAHAQKTDPWQFDTAILYYGESDDRVQAVEGIFAAKKIFSADQILTLKATIDGLTGASANGAVPQDQPQTFTRPSGNGQYEVTSGEIPLDDTFHDTRVQLNTHWQQPFGDNNRYDVGAHISKEYDYLSIGLSAGLSRDFNRKNTTISLGTAYFNDTLTSSPTKSAS